MSENRLNDRYEIKFSVSMPELASPGAAAYKVIDTKSPSSNLFALVPDPRLPLRVAAVSTLKLIRNPTILTPIEWGTMPCPPLKRHAEVLVFEQPMGGRLVNSCEDVIEPWTEDQIAERLLTPILPAMRSLAVEGVTHRAIRPNNILFNNKTRSVAILGDCVTAPAGLYQPAAYETIENIMATPIARGSGTFADDFYALGVTILYLFTGHSPASGVSDRELLERKLQLGSFFALVGDKRLSANLSELLRGLLHDDPTDRWSAQELEYWLNGRRMTPKTAPLPPRASRALDVGGEECWTARSVSAALGRTGDAAMDIFQGNTAQNWLLRSLGDKILAERVAVTLANGDDSGSFQNARRATQLAIVFDPPAPIRYRGVAAFPSGLGAGLAAAMMGNGEPGPYAEIIQHRFVQFWCHNQRPSRWSDYLPQISRDFDRLFNWLVDPKPGYGIERVVYELNPKLHCLSPVIEADHVTQLEQLLPALEQAVAAGKIEAVPVDRHVAAFIAASTRKTDDKLWVGMGMADPAIRLLSMLYALAILQTDQGPDKLPALAKLFSRQAGLLIDRFRNRRTRQRLKDGLADVVASGQLIRMVQFLDDPDEHKKDYDNFNRARVDYANARTGVQLCDRRRQILPQETVQTAGSLSVLVSSVLSLVAFGLFFAWRS